MAAPNQIDPSYPWGGYYHSGAAPEGGDETVNKIVKQGLAAIAPILEAAAGAFGATVERVSPYYSPGDPAPGDSELKYGGPLQPSLAEASPAVAVIRGTVPRKVKLAKPQAAAKGNPAGTAGLGAGVSIDTKQLAKDAAIDAVKTGAATTAATALGYAPAARLGVQAANIILDPKGAFANRAASLNTAIGVVSAGLCAAGAVSTTLPVIGWAIGAGMAIKSFVDMRKAGEAAEREEERWESLIKSVKSASDLLVKDAQALANNLVARGVVLGKTGDGTRLWNHYAAQARAYQAKANGLDEFRKRFPALQAEYLVKNKAWHEAEKAAIAAEMSRRETAFKAALARLGSKTTAQIDAAWQARKNIDAIDVADKAKANSDKNWRPIPGKPPAPAEKLNSLEADANRIGRQQTLRMLLQAARDCRIMNDVLVQEPAVVSATLTGAVAGKLLANNPKMISAPAARSYEEMAPAEAVAVEAGTHASGGGSGGAGAALAAGAALVTLVALGEDGGDDMFFGANNDGLGAVKASKAQKAEVKTAKREAAKAVALRKVELRAAAKTRAVELLAKRKEVVAAKKSAKLDIAKERAAAKVVAAKQKAELSEAKRASRLAKVRDQAAQAAAQGATPEAAAASAMAYDAQQYPGEPLVNSPAQVEPLMQASEYADPAASAWATPVPEQGYPEAEQVEGGDEAWAIAMPAKSSPWDELQYEPPATQAAEAELVDTADEGDVEYQEAAGAVEAEGSLTPYPGQEIPTVTGEEEWAYEQEVVPERNFRARGFFGLGAVAQAKVVAKRAAVKAAAKGAKPAQAVAVARRVARRFFARQDFFAAACRRA